MLDAHIRPIIDPLLSKAGKWLGVRGISANMMTGTGFLLGLIAMGFIAYQHYGIGLLFILLNRICDGLDGGIARHNGLSDLGGYLDIVADFIIYAAIIFGFILAQPEDAIWGAFLIFSYIGATCSFLGYAIIAAKRGYETVARGKKTIYYLGGLCEGTETILLMIIMCLIPQHFSILAMIYGVMCWVTCISRSLQARQDFTVRE